jgi:hypothetical protein
MKTTVEIPDKLYREIKARAALRGQTIKAFFLDALRAKLDGTVAANGKTKAPKGWRAVFGAADKEDMAELQRIVDEEFSRIDPEDWS